MIYLQMSNRSHLLILERGNLDHLRGGGTVISPDQEVCLTATHDAVWLGAEIESAVRAGILNDELLFTLIADSRKRPIVNDRPNVPLRMVIDKGELVPPPEGA